MYNFLGYIIGLGMLIIILLRIPIFFLLILISVVLNICTEMVKINKYILVGQMCEFQKIRKLNYACNCLNYFEP